MNPQKRQELLFNLYVQKEGVVTSITNFCLVAEAMFLVALAGAINIQPAGFQFLFEFAGLTLSLIWLNLGKRSYRNLGLLQDTITDSGIFPEWTKWVDACKDEHGIGFLLHRPAHAMICAWLPRIFIVVWILAIALSWMVLGQSGPDKPEEALHLLNASINSLHITPII